MSWRVQRAAHPRFLSRQQRACVGIARLAYYSIGGGFPAARKLDDIERVQLLQTYVQLTVARDVVERSGYSNAAFVQNLARIVTASSARDFSINKVHVQSKARGYSPGRDSIAAMLVDFEDAHLAYGVYEFPRSVQKIRQGGFKMYSVDPGLMSALSLATTDGLTRALETAVYLELRRRRKTDAWARYPCLNCQAAKEVDSSFGGRGVWAHTHWSKFVWT